MVSAEQEEAQSIAKKLEEVMDVSVCVLAYSMCVCMYV